VVYFVSHKIHYFSFHQKEQRQFLTICQDFFSTSQNSQTALPVMPQGRQRFPPPLEKKKKQKGRGLSHTYTFTLNTIVQGKSYPANVIHLK